MYFCQNAKCANARTMKTIVILMIFGLLILLGAVWSLISTYRAVFADLKTREFKQSCSRKVWRKVVVFLPIFGAIIYHTVFIYEPEDTG